MSLRALLKQRRYRHLSLALFAALAVHLGLVLTGNWGILLFSAPSNQNRVLTLTLENTTYEGLKETSLKEDDTLNDAKLGKAAKVKPESPQLADSLTDKAQELEPERPKEQSKEQPKEPSEEPPKKQIETASKPLQQQSEPEESQANNLIIPELSSEPNSEPNSEIGDLASDSKRLLELITATELSSVKLNQRPLVKSTEVKSTDLADNALASVALDVRELKMLDKKVKRWASSISKIVESPSPLEWRENGQQYVANFRKVSAENDMDTDEVLVEIATKRDGKKLTTNLRLKKMAFSNFAQFIHHWDTAVSVHDDEMNGRFHSNTKINLVANRRSAPLFHGKVTTASYFVDIEGNASRKEIFLAGLETGVKRIAMPKPKVLFDQVRADDTINSTLIERDSRLIFNHDGSYLLQAHTDVGVMQRYQIGEQPLYILAAPGVSLSVSGTLNGAVAVYSPKRIIIEGNLEYANTENIDQGGDFLGLISGRSVVIANRKMVPEGDLNIQAAIYAKTRFKVSQLTGKRMGTLNILGSVSAGTITATEPRYATNIIFDTRLENLRPPGFPVTDRYELLAKQNRWQIDDDPFYEPLDEGELEELLIDNDQPQQLD